MTNSTYFPSHFILFCSTCFRVLCDVIVTFHFDLCDVILLGFRPRFLLREQRENDNSSDGKYMSPPIHRPAIWNKIPCHFIVQLLQRIFSDVIRHFSMVASVHLILKFLWWLVLVSINRLHFKALLISLGDVFYFPQLYRIPYTQQSSMCCANSGT